MDPSGLRPLYWCWSSVLVDRDAQTLQPQPWLRLWDPVVDGPNTDPPSPAPPHPAIPPSTASAQRPSALEPGGLTAQPPRSEDSVGPHSVPRCVTLLIPTEGPRGGLRELSRRGQRPPAPPLASRTHRRLLLLSQSGGD
ncbi:unnamed protein product [Arctogadus glacialis]